MRKLVFTLGMAGLAFLAYGQQVRPANSADVYREISQLGHLSNVLYLAAHPDDENTRMLAWLVGDQHVKAAYLSVTRGDGGQNILGSEQGPALGLIRTHELLEARKIDGADQYFTRAIDFGFSKSSEETLKHWNEDLLAGDVTWIFRKYRPDVVICRFPPTARAGHGQHSSSTILAEDAFKSSGDPTQYPDQLKFYPVWKPRRLLWNTFRFGNFNTTSEDQFKITVGQYAPLKGMGYGELAGIIRSMHKSQGAGTPSVPGLATEYFSSLEGEPATSSLFDGIDITWNRVGRKDIGDKINTLISGFSFLHPDASLPALLEIRAMIGGVKDDFWRNQKLAEIDKIILDCAGFLAELYTRRPEAAAGMTLPFTLNVIGRSSTPVLLKSVDWIGETTSENVKINGDELLTREHKITLPSNTPLTEPYWLSEPPVNDAMYSIPDDSLRGLPEAPNRLSARLTLEIGNQTLSVDVPLSYKTTDPEKGDLVEPLRIVPDVTLDFMETLLLTAPDGTIHTSIRLHSYNQIRDGKLVFSTSEPVLTMDHITLQADEDTVIAVTLPLQGKDQAGTDGYLLKAEFQASGKINNKTLHMIRYSHIPTLQYFTPSSVKVLRNDWKCTAKKIGYIAGAGDYMLRFLQLAGFNVDILGDADFTDAGKLSQYDAIVEEVRALNVEPRMKQWMPLLLEYVHNGGTLIMQYNRTQDLATRDFGPYPLTITNDRVTEEDAKVTFLDPADRLLNYPNKITANDFNDWVQELGLNFPGTWDDQYKPLFAMSDTGESPLRGATLYASYGKGTYIYTSLSLFRQLPAGNKGAIRILMNMLSAGH